MTQSTGIQLVEKNGEHWYYVPELDKEVKSVTTYLKRIAKPHLIIWALKLAANYLIDNFRVGMTLAEFKTLVATAVDIYNKTRDDAGDVGSRVHGIIDDFMKLVIAGQEPADPMVMVKEEVDFRVVSCFRAFLDWYKKSGYRPIFSEKRQASLIHEFAGTIDDAGIIGDKTVLMDLKSSNQINDDYYLQVAAYVYMEEERDPDIRFDEAWIIRLGKNDGAFEARCIARKDIDFAFETFLAAKRLDSGLEQIKSINKVQKRVIEL